MTKEILTLLKGPALIPTYKPWFCQITWDNGKWSGMTLMDDWVCSFLMMESEWISSGLNMSVTTTNWF